MHPYQIMCPTSSVAGLQRRHQGLISCQSHRLFGFGLMRGPRNTCMLAHDRKRWRTKVHGSEQMDAPVRVSNLPEDNGSTFDLTNAVDSF